MIQISRVPGKKIGFGIWTIRIFIRSWRYTLMLGAWRDFIED